ncbi:major facilitator superfamily domain-containing protein [Neohortaea acidophila]|uniref:Major facilitator superfamily domain-containing protein n=1 Tax=Neohortaea acidophila TaxID=245834 RepID=A0A6A6PZX4_9PEZI|nr:major facilitator superfamily domain-containing protein [Neohortaea acidophila]KAF2484727.1 major facilitator superfamily domain-containing protein [Neohortaea acidophila]
MENPMRKKVLRVLFISLLLDLISFTFILPLFPQLLEFYRNIETQSSSNVLSRILAGLNAYKNSFSKPISARYDIVLLGGALGSLFSLCQAIASPVIGRLSDKYGRRTALLWSMVGNIASVMLWCVAVDFRTFLASRIVGGLSEGNIQLALAIATDISTDEQRGRTMAMVGACFSIAFTFGPALGAALSQMTTVAANPFATAAGFSLFLIVTETIYLYVALPETHPRSTSTANGGSATTKKPVPEAESKRTNSRLLLNLTHFSFILFFSGMEFSLPFMTYDLFSYESKQSGRLLGFIGLIASLFQGGVTRRMHPLRVVQTGVISCAFAFFILGRLTTERELYVAATLLAITSSTVVTGLNSLSSFEASRSDRGEKLGDHRSFGQIGRALGPLIFCSLYWWAGRDVAYFIGGTGMVAVAGLVFAGLKPPVGLVVGKKRAAVTEGTKTNGSVQKH